MKVIVVDEEKAFAEKSAEVVVEHATRAIEAHGKFVLALTGGSSPIPMHRALAEPPFADRIDWTKVHIVFGDERAVPRDAQESNFRSAHVTLLSRVPIPEAQVLRMEADRPDLAAAARDYERRLIQLCEARVDLVCVGLGEDAHIFSLYPGSPAIEEAHALVVAEIDPPMKPALSRITFTPRMLDRAGAVLVLATGEKKKSAVLHALESSDQPHRFPAHLLRRAMDRTFVLDRAAASGLTRTLA
jgi:6-phosphogluconolactonase